MWADNETDEDLLGFSLHADLVGGIVTDSEMLPVTIGLFGDWGSGKSSIIKLLQRQFEEHPDYAFISFNSWTFEGYEDAKAAILTSLLTELRENRNLTSKAKDEINSLIKRVDVMKALKSLTSAGLAYLTANPSFLLGVRNPLKIKGEEQGADSEEKSSPSGNIDISSYYKEVEETVHTVRSFRSDFQKLIEKTDLKALVILIDDLDRCSPERVIENLEAVKLFLNVRGTAFVVAADRRIVENAIRIRYSELFAVQSEARPSHDSLVTDYLEKLIQIPYTLPKLAPHEVRSYMSLLFLKKHLDESKFKQVLSEYSDFISRERYTPFPLEDTLSTVPDGQQKKDLHDCIRLVEACSDAITDGLKGNPRQIKRFLNAFWVRRKLGQVAQLSHVKDHILVKLMVLEYVDIDCFDEIFRLHRQSPDGRVEKIAEMEKTDSFDESDERYSGWGKMHLRKWLKSEPKLGNEDLRDYFWLSRSSLGDTLSGVRLLTHAMRRCLDSFLLGHANDQIQTLFVALSGDEQAGVLSMVTKEVIRRPGVDRPLESLLQLGLAGSALAAEAFRSCIRRIGAENLKPGLGIKLKNAQLTGNDRAMEIIGQIRAELAETSTKIGRAINKKRSQVNRHNGNFKRV